MTFYHELRLAHTPEGSPVKLHTVSDDALVYYQDSPELNVIDWNISVKTSLDQVAGLRLGHVIELPRADIAHFNPAQIYAGKTKFSRAGSGTATGATTLAAPTAAGCTAPGPVRTPRAAMTRKRKRMKTVSRCVGKGKCILLSSAPRPVESKADQRIGGPQ